MPGRTRSGVGGPVNLYDVLRLMISKMPLPETQAADCLKVLEEAERMNMLGTSAKQMNIQAHEHQFNGSQVCALCGRGPDE